MLREAGIEVVENVLEKECLALNRRFAHGPQPCAARSYSSKWAQSADNFIGLLSPRGIHVRFHCPIPVLLSKCIANARWQTPYSSELNVISDNPTLTTRLWPGIYPALVLFASDRMPHTPPLWQETRYHLDPSKYLLRENLSDLYSIYKITHLLW